MPQPPGSNRHQPKVHQSGAGARRPSVLAGFGAIVGAAIAAAYVGWVTTQIGLAPFVTAWSALSSAVLIVAGSLLVCSYLVRAARVRSHFLGQYASPPPPGTFSLTSVLLITLQHNALSLAIPMRVGEISFPLLVYRRFRVPIATGTVSLLWMRLLDLHVLISIILAALLVFISTWLLATAPSLELQIPEAMRSQIENRGGWLLVGGAVLLLAWQSPIPLAARLGHRLGGNPRAGESRLQRLRHQIQAGMPTHPRPLLQGWGWTALNWSIKLAAIAILLIAFVQIAQIQLGSAEIGQPTPNIH